MVYLQVETLERRVGLNRLRKEVLQAEEWSNGVERRKKPEALDLQRPWLDQTPHKDFVKTSPSRTSHLSPRAVHKDLWHVPRPYSNEIDTYKSNSFTGDVNSDSVVKRAPGLKMKTNIDAIKEELAKAEALLGSLERSVSSASFTSPPASPCTSFIHTAGRRWSNTSSPTTSSVGSPYKSTTSPSNSPTTSPLDKVMTFPHNSDLYEKASTFSGSSSSIGTQLSNSSALLIPSTTSHQAQSDGVSSLLQRNAGSVWVQSLPSSTGRLTFLTNTIGSTREAKFAQSGQLFRPQASPMIRTIPTTQIHEKEQQTLSTHLYSSCSSNNENHLFVNGNAAESTNHNGSHATSERPSAMTKNTDSHMTSMHSPSKNAQGADEPKICSFLNKSTQTVQVDLMPLTRPSVSSSFPSECCQVVQRELDTVRQRNQRLHGLLASQSRKMHDLMEQRKLLEKNVEEKEQQNMVLKLQLQQFQQELPGQDHLNGENSNSFRTLLTSETPSAGNSYPLLRLTGINE